MSCCAAPRKPEDHAERTHGGGGSSLAARYVSGQDGAAATAALTAKETGSIFASAPFLERSPSQPAVPEMQPVDTKEVVDGLPPNLPQRFNEHEEDRSVIASSGQNTVHEPLAHPASVTVPEEELKAPAGKTKTEEGVPPPATDQDGQSISSTEDTVDRDAGTGSTELQKELRKAAADNMKLQLEKVRLQTEIQTMDLLYLHAKGLVNDGGETISTSGDPACTIDPDLQDAAGHFQAGVLGRATRRLPDTATSSVDDPDVLDALITDGSAECEAATGAAKQAKELRQVAAANEKLRLENAQLQTELETMDLLYLHAKDFIKHGVS